MSIKAMNWATAMRGISMPQKLCLMILADCHNAERGQCNPKVEHIAEVACGSVRSIKSALIALDEAGLISRNRGFSTGYFYTLHLGKSAPDARAPSAPMDISAESARATDAPNKVRQMHVIGAADAPNHYIEPELEPEVEPEQQKSLRAPCGAHIEFNVFWSRYRNKPSKKEALKAWDKLNPSEHLVAEILRDLDHKDMCGYWQCNSQLHGSTYLNQERWLDGPDAVERHVRSHTDKKMATSNRNKQAADEFLRSGI